MKDILFIDNYDSYSYNILQIIEEYGYEYTAVYCDEAEPDMLRAFRSVIVSPGPGVPADYPIHAEAIRHCVLEKKKYLGVCLGHQSLGVYFGAVLRRFEEPFHGVRPLLHYTNGEELYGGVPNPFHAGLYHSWYLDKQAFPSALIITSESENGIIMGIRHHKLPLFGVQFHPESFMTENGESVLGNWLRM